MGNHFFQCKQFTVHQDRCAMKVTTDACLFGAATATYLQGKLPENILDIGAGTGLLSLMLAQVFDARIDAVEVEPNAADQAVENCSNSSWHQKIQVHACSIQEFVAISKTKYDIIICNPPFFADQLKSATASRNLAMHQTNLRLSTLFSIVQQLLDIKGFFSLLLPYERASESIQNAFKYGLALAHQIHIKQTDTHDYFRVIQFFTPQASVGTSRDIIIKTNNAYSADFSSLLAPYYLHL